MTEYSPDIADLGDRIAGLTLQQAVSLENYLKDHYGIEAETGGSLVMPLLGEQAIPIDADVKSVFDVFLKSTGDKKINVIKVVRALTGLGLKEAKDLVDSAPSMVKDNLSTVEADKFKKELEEAGATVELR